MALIENEDLSQQSELEAVEEQQQAQAAAAPEAPKIPDKYKGKSLEEIVTMHQEAEKLIGRQAQEVGEVRRLADELLKQQLSQKKEKPPEVENELDFFEDPKLAVQKAVASHPDVLAAKQAAMQMRQLQTQAALAKKHPDFANVVQDPEFAAWVKSSPMRVNMYALADAQYDFNAADELISTFKAIKGTRTNEAVTAAKEVRQTENVTVTTAATFIPEVWSDEIVAAYKKSLVAANLIKKMNFKGKKGDTVHIPAPTRGDASAKAAGSQVTLIAATEGEKTVAIDQHWEYSRLIEDIVEAQALSSLRQFYTDDAGYALGRQVDTTLIRLGRKVQGGGGTAAYSGAFSGADGTTAYNAGANTGSGALTDAAIRRSIQRLDDQDVPMDGRFLIVPPSTRNTLMGIARFTEQAFVGEQGGANTIRNGEIGNVYGIPVFVTSNADTTSGSTATRICLLAHKDFAVLVEQMGVRTQTQYKQEYLGTLFTADVLFGCDELRDNAAVALAVPA